jgi:plasmid stabilization system protein ParE
MRLLITAAAQADLLGIRRCLHGIDPIVDRLQPQPIEVIHVLQGARDREALS